MHTFLAFLLIGIVDSAIYAISASGLVLTYVTSGIFNFAHGAIGMMLAFLYWELHVHHHVSAPLALAITLLLVAPAIGIVLDGLIMRRLLTGASLATKLVVTLALLLACIGLAQAIWGVEIRSLPLLWGRRSYKVSGLVINWDQTTIVLAAIAVAIGIRLLLRRTRLGVAMRAVVDSPELCQIKGLGPRRITAASWALGSMLAGLSAILIAPGLNLDPNVLSLLVVSAYAAAIWGRLESLPQTFVGALILGVGQVMLTGYLPSGNEIVTELAPAVPFLLLFVALLIRSQRRLPEPTITPPQPAPPRSRLTLGLAAGAFLVAIPVSQSLKDFQLVTASKGLVFACIIMSLMLLTGLSGQVSIMQMSFAGIGAVVLGKLPLSVPYPVALALAAVAAGAVGVLVALPAVRLRGIYLALSTLAFAVLLDSMFFGNSHIMGGGTTLAIRRPSFLGVNLHSERSLFILLVLAAGLFANVVLAVRRSHFGRVLAALRDSPLAAQMCGMNTTAVKLKVFGFSALMAGLAGGLLGSLQVRAGQSNFIYIQSLSILLIATVFGISNVSGALLGAFFFAVLPNLAAHAGSKSTAVQPLVVGGLAVLTARHAEGIAGYAQARLRDAWATLSRAHPQSLQPEQEVIDLREPAMTGTRG